MAVIPQIAGTSAGVGVFLQFFGGACFAQLYGLLANGRPEPMVFTATLAAALALAFGAVSFVMKRCGKEVEAG